MLHRRLIPSSLLVVIAIGASACGGSGSETPPPVEPTSPTRPESEAVRRAEPEPTPEEADPEGDRPEETAEDPEGESSE